MTEHINSEVARAILLEVSSSSRRIATLAGRAFDYGDDADKLDAYLAAIELMARHAGWLSELAAEQLGERVGLLSSDALDWLMPAHCKFPRVEG